MIDVSFTIDAQPMGKQRPRFNGHAYTPKKTRDYEKLVSVLARQARADKPLIESAVSAKVCAYFPIPTSWNKKKREQALSGEIYPTVKPDTDNILKIIFDACNGIVYADDKQIVKTIFEKRYSDQARVDVSFLELCA